MGVINLNHRMDEVEKKAADGIALANAAQETADNTFVAQSFGTITDANNILTPGVYYRLSNVANVSNRPSGATGSFLLEVIQMSAEGQYVLQRYTDCTTSKTYQRVYRKANTTWTDWTEFAFVTT